MAVGKLPTYRCLISIAIRHIKVAPSINTFPEAEIAIYLAGSSMWGTSSKLGMVFFSILEMFLFVVYHIERAIG